MPGEPRRGISQGIRLPLPTRRTFFSLKYWRRVVTCLNALLNMRVGRGNAFAVQISDLNTVISIPESESETPTPSGSNPWQVTQPNEGTDDWQTVSVAAGRVIYTPLVARILG